MYVLSPYLHLVGGRASMHDIPIANNFVCILRSQDLKSRSNFPIILSIMLQIVFTCNKNFCAMYFSYMAV
jgi:hypothetical protein